jgi:hypothetical protein
MTYKMYISTNRLSIRPMGRLCLGRDGDMGKGVEWSGRLR